MEKFVAEGFVKNIPEQFQMTDSGLDRKILQI
jgi:hypothetical protein